MKIILVRHGKPKIDMKGSVSASDFGTWISEYNATGIDVAYPPPTIAIEKAESCAITVCSDLPRSLESAKLLSQDAQELISPLFRECEMPYCDWNYPKLPKSAWSVMFRLLQRLGYSPNAESYQDMNERSKACALQLADLAQRHGSILLIGHGVLNWLIHRHLLEMGWSGPSKSAKDHWGITEYGQYV